MKDVKEEFDGDSYSITGGSERFQLGTGPVGKKYLLYIGVEKTASIVGSGRYMRGQIMFAINFTSHREVIRFANSDYNFCNRTPEVISLIEFKSFETQADARELFEFATDEHRVFNLSIATNNKDNPEMLVHLGWYIVSRYQYKEEGGGEGIMELDFVPHFAKGDVFRTLNEEAEMAANTREFLSGIIWS